MNNMNRRQVLIAIANISAAMSLGSCATGENNSNAVNQDLETLASVAFDLFPYKTLPPELYIRVAERLLGLESQVVNAGLDNLYNLAGKKRWIDVQENKRIQILSTFEQSEFFALMRSTAIDVLYKTPEMFELLGYGGSAIEQGGYINRGFDDVDWLPSMEKVQ